MRYRICLLTFFISVALTFHFLQSRAPPDPTEWEKSSLKGGHDGNEDVPAPKISRLADPTVTGWIVLPGNVTVHVGVEESTKIPTFLLNPQHLCHTFHQQAYKLLVFVASQTDNFTRRQAIRDTWALKVLQEALNVRVVFVLGQSNEATQKLVIDESFRYGDILQVDLPESFQNLAMKSLAGLSWSANFCQTADFVMKTDDDILIHVPNLIKAIKTAKNPETLLLCHENRMRKIVRKEFLKKIPKKYSKYQVSIDELPGAYYPPYCSGMGYVFSRAVRDDLLQASVITPLFFIEDVYLTGFCRYKAAISITSHAGITLRPPLTVFQAVCAFKEGRITSQEVQVEELRHLWAEANTQGFFCPKLLGYAREIRQSVNAVGSD